MFNLNDFLIEGGVVIVNVICTHTKLLGMIFHKKPTSYYHPKQLTLVIGGVDIMDGQLFRLVFHFYKYCYTW